jgi:hypothetical protein
MVSSVAMLEVAHNFGRGCMKLNASVIVGIIMWWAMKETYSSIRYG